MSIEENVARVRENIARAAAAAGRAAGEITLVAATKMNDAQRVREAIAAGVDVCGENRVQELLEKNEQGAYEGCPLHFIGALQKNKVKYLVGTVSLIQSVDSLELAAAIDKKAGALGLVQDILLEVNIGNESSKSGVSQTTVGEMAEKMGDFGHLKVRGLMTIPPICANSEENKPYFQRMYKLFVDIAAEKYDNVSMDFLSMGMTDDYETAISMGANMIRVGTGIFGHRNYGGV